MSALRFAPVETPLGPMLVAATEAGVAAISRTTEISGFLAALTRRFPGSEPLPAESELSGARSWLCGFLAGERRDLADVDLRGLSPFDRRVYEAVRAIPYGSTATYGEIAAAIGSAGAARAVGGAMSRCPLFPAVPCQRVVRAVDGFSGWGGDVAVKRRLLELEAESVSGSATAG